MKIVEKLFYYIFFLLIIFLYICKIYDLKRLTYLYMNLIFFLYVQYYTPVWETLHNLHKKFIFGEVKKKYNRSSFINRKGRKFIFLLNLFYIIIFFYYISTFTFSYYIKHDRDFYCLEIEHKKKTDKTY